MIFQAALVPGGKLGLNVERMAEIAGALLRLGMRKEWENIGLTKYGKSLSNLHILFRGLSIIFESARFDYHMATCNYGQKTTKSVPSGPPII